MAQSLIRSAKRARPMLKTLFHHAARHLCGSSGPITWRSNMSEQVCLIGETQCIKDLYST